jgi:hypothetical protein
MEEGTMSQNQEVRGRATAIFTGDDGMTRIIYRGTAVVTFNSDRVILDTGGWRTVTTKLRMNQAANQFGLGFRVQQKDGEWIVWVRRPGREFSEMHLFGVHDRVLEFSRV